MQTFAQSTLKYRHMLERVNNPGRLGFSKKKIVPPWNKSFFLLFTVQLQSKLLLTFENRERLVDIPNTLLNDWPGGSRLKVEQNLDQSGPDECFTRAGRPLHRG